MKHTVWGLDTRLRTVIPVTAVAMVVASAPARTWPAILGVVAGATAVVALGVITVGGFTVPQWLGRRWAVWRARRRGQASPAPVASPGHEHIAGGLAGGRAWPETVSVAGEQIAVTGDPDELICVLDLHGHPHQTHQMHARRIATEAEVPTEALEFALRTLAEGAPGTVDIVLDARRLVRTNYAGAYDGQVAGATASGERRTLLVARFAPQYAVPYFAARPSLATAAATALSRIAGALRAAGCPCTPLGERDLAELSAVTEPGGAPAWGHVPAAFEPGFDTVYEADAEVLSDERFDELWALRADRVIATVRRDRHGAWTLWVRVRTPRPAQAPPLPWLRRLSGQQGEAAHVGRPVPQTARVRTCYAPTSQPPHRLPCGADGQVVGLTATGDQVLIPLVPGADVLSARVHPVYAEQLILRAAATGARVTIITDNDRRWARLLGDSITVAAPGSERPGGRVDLHVYDGVSAPTFVQNATIALLSPNDKLEGKFTMDQRGDQISVLNHGQVLRLRAHVDPAEVAFLPSTRMAPAGAR